MATFEEIVQLHNSLLDAGSCYIHIYIDAITDVKPCPFLSESVASFVQSLAAIAKKVRHEQAPKKRPVNFFKHPWIVETCPKNEFGDNFFPAFFFTLSMSDLFCNAVTNGAADTSLIRDAPGNAGARSLSGLGHRPALHLERHGCILWLSA